MGGEDPGAAGFHGIRPTWKYELSFARRGAISRAGFTRRGRANGFKAIYNAADELGQHHLFCCQCAGGRGWRHLVRRDVRRGRDGAGAVCLLPRDDADQHHRRLPPSVLPALEWVSQHRDHHRYVDTDRDPYSIKKGFFYAHLGWMIFWKHDTDYDNVTDLARDPMLMHQHQHYLAWAIGAGIVTPMIVGILTGHLLAAIVFSVCLRITVVHHLTFFINSICHMFGKATYDTHATARDNWFIALLTFGEGYHNFHHRFAADYRNGVRWYQWDPSKWLIALMAGTGLAWDLRRVSDFQIMAAELAGQNSRASDWFERVGQNAEMLKLKEAVQQQYDHVRQNLARWEKAARDYRGVLQRKVAQQSAEVKEAASRQLAEARQQFERAHRNWKTLLSQCPAAA
ncbi:MAG: acyl-CoA desaturase [Gammaproteobacteria bacterium PRO9]|nr:acyl-CoA desaturase [Gammaproteobacteria bacterium PRO9]